MKEIGQTAYVKTPIEKNMKKRHWFVAKQYGWGWTPATWEGWVIMLAYLYALTIDFIALVHSSGFSMLRYLLNAFFLTAFLIAVCYVTGEKPSWRWGLRKKKNT